MDLMSTIEVARYSIDGIGLAAVGRIIYKGTVMSAIVYVQINSIMKFFKAIRDGKRGAIAALGFLCIGVMVVLSGCTSSAVQHSRDSNSENINSVVQVTDIICEQESLDFKESLLVYKKAKSDYKACRNETTRTRFMVNPFNIWRTQNAKSNE